MIVGTNSILGLKQYHFVISTETTVCVFLELRSVSSTLTTKDAKEKLTELTNKVNRVLA